MVFYSINAKSHRGQSRAFLTSDLISLHILVQIRLCSLSMPIFEGE